VQRVLQSLLDLQNVDMRLSDVRARLAGFPKKLAEVQSRVAAARAEVEASKAAQLATIKDRKKYELDVEQWKERVRKYKDQTSQVKTNEAYRALLHEVQTAEEEIAKAEDRLLEQMVAGEEYDRRVKASERMLKDVEEVARGSRTKIEVDKSTADKELAELNAERARVVAEIPEGLIDHYERIAKKHNGIALAEVRDEMCSACGMRVRPHVFQEMRRSASDEMFHCETCTRILYYIEPEAFVPPGTEDAAEAAKPDSSSREN
jgi:predicted  nucleic acid-binding Zn-ribbon protein